MIRLDDLKTESQRKPSTQYICIINKHSIYNILPLINIFENTFFKK